MDGDTLKRIKIARIVTVPEAFVHIKAFLNFLRTKDCDVTLVSSEGPYAKVIRGECSMEITSIAIAREINLIQDLISLFRLTIFFYKNKFDIVHSSTPKAGLLVAIAGFIARVPVRIHTFTGQRWATLQGEIRTLLKMLDQLIISLNSQCYADSASQIEFLIEQGVAEPGKVTCINKGSYGGINTEKFNRARFPNAKTELCDELKISDQSVLILFVGRVTREKGVEELVRAFVESQKKFPKLKLIMVGPLEPLLDPIDQEILDIIRDDKNIFSLGFKTNPEKYFSACDIFCLPSYREGFGTVVLEAAACGIPTIGTNIPGLKDSVAHGETGILVPLKDIKALENALTDLGLDNQKRKLMGENALLRARKDFDSSILAEMQWSEYLRLLSTRS